MYQLTGIFVDPEDRIEAFEGFTGLRIIGGGEQSRDQSPGTISIHLATATVLTESNALQIVGTVDRLIEALQEIRRKALRAAVEAVVSAE